MRCLIIFLRFLGVILSPVVLVLSLIIPAFSYIILGDKNNVAPYDFIDKFYGKLGKL
jgi:hypothetical protein